MERAVLQELLSEGLSVEQIAARMGAHRATVQKWLKRHGLLTARAAQLRASRAAVADGRETVMRVCQHHGITEFKRRGGTNSFRCLKCRSAAVMKRRRLVKEILVKEAGGCCALCGYHRYEGALEFHHRDPAEKSFSLSHAGVTRSLDRAREEAAKCVLLCANCHAEVEGGVAALP